jgi:hypothetical protein
MARGALSFSKVRALTRVATPEDEGEMPAFALESTISTLERAVRGWKKRNRAAEKEWERALHESRSLSIFPDGEDDTAPISGTRAERYQVVLHVDPATLSESGEPGRSELEDGIHVYLAALDGLAGDDTDPHCGVK